MWLRDVKIRDEENLWKIIVKLKRNVKIEKKIKEKIKKFFCKFVEKYLFSSFNSKCKLQAYSYSRFSLIR